MKIKNQLWFQQYPPDMEAFEIYGFRCFCMEGILFLGRIKGRKNCFL
jgi:hypothetical protein